MKLKDVTVLGAGIGGLFAGALWAKKGHKVSIYESHTLNGGCAGYFQRKYGTFDVGATTISGLKDGRPLQQILKRLDIKLDTYAPDICIQIFHDNLIFNYYRDNKKFIQEVKSKYNLDLKEDLKDLIDKEETLWRILSQLRQFPKINIFELSIIVVKFFPFFIKNISLFTKNFKNYLPRHIRDNSLFMKMIDEVLLISTQATSSDTLAFVGILGFLYPLDSYYLRGGMKTLVTHLEDSILSNKGEIFNKHFIQTVTKNNNEFKISFKNHKEISSQLVISNINPKLILNDKSGSDQKWNAIVAYLYLDDFMIDIPFTQIHIRQSEKSIFNCPSIFISSSLVNDFEKSPTNKQIITISAHVSKEFTKSNLDKESYEKVKDDFKELIYLKFSEILNIPRDKIHFDSVATAKTFNHFTKRHEGEVGGYPINNIFDLLKLRPNHFSKNMYLVGDYAFPGQGIAAIAQGAMKTIED